MSDSDSEDPEIRKFEREMDFREKNLDAANEFLKEAPGLLGELTEQVILPLMKNLSAGRRQQQVWEPPEPPQRNGPQYRPEKAKNEDVPGPHDFNNENDSND